MIAENSFANNTSKSWQRWLDKCFIAFATIFFFLLPLQTRFIFRAPIDRGVPYEYGTLSVFLVEVLGWVVIGLGSIKIKNEKLKIKNGWLLILPFLAFASILWAVDKAVALQAAARLFEGVLLYVVVVVVAQTFRSESGRSKDLRYMLWWSFIMGATVQAILGIQQFLSQSSFASTLLGMALHDPRALGTSVVEFGDQRWLRAYGGLPNPNVLGGYLVVAWGLLSYWVIKLRDKVTTLLWKVTTPILLTGIFFTFSRAAWIAAIVVMGYWVIKLLKKRTGRSLVYVLLTTFYVLLLGLTFRPLVETRLAFHSSARLETKSRVERVSGLRESWEVIKRHPMLGVGIGNYTQALAKELRPGNHLWAYQPVHNVFLLVMAELGIMGLILLLALFYAVVRQSQFYILHFTFLILLMADHYLWTLPFGVFLFWAVLGLTSRLKCAIMHTSKPEQETTNRPA